MMEQLQCRRTIQMNKNRLSAALLKYWPRRSPNLAPECRASRHSSAKPPWNHSRPLRFPSQRRARFRRVLPTLMPGKLGPTLSLERAGRQPTYLDDSPNHALGDGLPIGIVTREEFIRNGFSSPLGIMPRMRVKAENPDL